MIGTTPPYKYKFGYIAPSVSPEPSEPSYGRMVSPTVRARSSGERAGFSPGENGLCNAVRQQSTPAWVIVNKVHIQWRRRVLLHVGTPDEIVVSARFDSVFHLWVSIE